MEERNGQMRECIWSIYLKREQRRKERGGEGEGEGGNSINQRYNFESKMLFKIFSKWFFLLLMKLVHNHLLNDMTSGRRCVSVLI